MNSNESYMCWMGPSVYYTKFSCYLGNTRIGHQYLLAMLQSLKGYFSDCRFFELLCSKSGTIFCLPFLSSNLGVVTFTNFHFHLCIFFATRQNVFFYFIMSKFLLLHYFIFLLNSIGETINDLFTLTVLYILQCSFLLKLLLVKLWQQKIWLRQLKRKKKNKLINLGAAIELFPLPLHNPRYKFIMHSLPRIVICVPLLDPSRIQNLSPVTN